MKNATIQFLLAFILALMSSLFIFRQVLKDSSRKAVNKTKIDGTYVKTNYIIDLIKDTDSVYIKTNDTIYKVQFNQIEKTINLDTN